VRDIFWNGLLCYWKHGGQGGWPVCFSFIVLKYLGGCKVNFVTTYKSDNYFFSCHALTHGTDLRRSPPLLMMSAMHGRIWGWSQVHYLGSTLTWARLTSNPVQFGVQPGLSQIECNPHKTFQWVCQLGYFTFCQNLLEIVLRIITFYYWWQVAKHT
jgi:hypothetical protein